MRQINSTQEMELKMKINKNLEFALTYNPTKKSYSMEVEEMCKKIEVDELTLPLYQRDVSWKIDKSIALLNFQLFGKAPVAPISINESISEKTDVAQISFLTREPVNLENKHQAKLQSVVDGQQRLTTNYKAYTDHEDYRNIVLDVSKAKFRKIEEAIPDTCIPVGTLLNRDPIELEKYLNKKGTLSKLYGVLTRVRSKMLSYNYTINIAENLSEDEQIEWFEILNNAGSRVTTLQMAFSKLKVKNLDIYKDFTNPFGEKVASRGLEEHFNPFTTNVSYPIAALNPAYEFLMKNKVHSNNYAPIPSDTKEDLIIKVDVDNLHKIILITLEALDLTLDFLEKNELIEIVDRMDYVLYMLGYFVFKGNDPVLEVEEEEALTKWVQEVNFTNLSNTERRKCFTDLLNINK